MAIAPSKLGEMVARDSPSDDALVRRLRDAGLVRDDASDDELKETFRKAREEHAALPPPQRDYNSPNERVRVFLAPYLSDKGTAWAVPLSSLDLPDDGESVRAPAPSSWWKWWR
jgi:hypothetical protein